MINGECQPTYKWPFEIVLTSYFTCFSSDGLSHYFKIFSQNIRSYYYRNYYNNVVEITITTQIIMTTAYGLFLRFTESKVFYAVGT